MYVCTNAVISFAGMMRLPSDDPGAHSRLNCLAAWSTASRACGTKSTMICATAAVVSSARVSEIGAEPV